jgi:uncharacterized protein YlaI
MKTPVALHHPRCDRCSRKYAQFTATYTLNETPIKQNLCPPCKRDLEKHLSELLHNFRLYIPLSIRLIPTKPEPAV